MLRDERAGRVRAVRVFGARLVVRGEDAPVRVERRGSTSASHGDVPDEPVVLGRCRGLDDAPDRGKARFEARVRLAAAGRRAG